MNWRPAAALTRVSVLPAGLAMLAVLARKPDLLVLAAPLALAALPLTHRPTGPPNAELALAENTVHEGATTQVTVSITGASGAQTAAVTLLTPDWAQPLKGARVATVVRPGQSGTVTVVSDLRAGRWGYSAVGPGSVTLSACGGLLLAGPAPLHAKRLRALPLSARYAGTQLLPRARGGVGVHRSLRLGEGSELAGVRPFAPGDRIRRINWRTSLRANELQVNTTTTDRDAAVQVLLDARYDAGISGGVGGQASGLDHAVRAVAALSAFYLSLGDRVGLVTYTEHPRVISTRAGRGQLDRVLTALLDTSVPRGGGVEPHLPAPPNLDPRALVLLVSPLVGRYVFERAAGLGRAGHTVVVIDTLPPDAVPADRGPWGPPVTDLWRLERRTRIGQLADLGVPVVPWVGTSTLDGVLRELARAAGRTGARQ